ILAEDHLAVRLGENFKGVALTDALGTPDLLGNDDAAQFVNAAHNACCSHDGTLPLDQPGLSAGSLASLLVCRGAAKIYLWFWAVHRRGFSRRAPTGIIAVDHTREALPHGRAFADNAVLSGTGWLLPDAAPRQKEKGCQQGQVDR